MERHILIDGREMEEPDPAELRVSQFLLWTLAAAILISTVLHHHFPRVFDVPLAAGIYMSDYHSMLALDLGVMALAWLCFRHAWRRQGLFAATVFLAGSFVFTGVEESMWILLGRWVMDARPELLAAEGEGLVANGTYYFTRGFFWFLETPVSAGLGWFLLAYSTVYMARLIIPRASFPWQAALAGALAVNVDLWVDPVQTHPHFSSWVWAKPQAGLFILGIPVTNFAGWFLLIFLFALLFHRLPALVKSFGAARGAFLFFAILMGFELAILVLFLAYGRLEQAFIVPPHNLTLWGIGG
jgi:hypothetical protein